MSSTVGSWNVQQHISGIPSLIRHLTTEDGYSRIDSSSIADDLKKDATPYCRTWHRTIDGLVRIWTYDVVMLDIRVEKFSPTVTSDMHAK